MWTWALKPLAPQALRAARRALRDRPLRISRLNPVLRKEFVSSPAVADHLHAFLEQRHRPPKDAREDHWRRLTSGLVPFVLEVADRAAARCGIEPRYPFFDRRLVEFCLALPAEQKLRRGWTRFVLRQAMEGILPPLVQWRPGKSDLTPAFLNALLTQDRSLLEELPGHAARTLHRYVNPDALKRTCDDALASGNEEAVFRIWPALTLSLWLGRAAPTVPPFHPSPTVEEALRMPQDTPQSNPPAADQAKSKQPYAKPQLTVHGSMAQLTTNIGTKGTDGFTGSKLS
jgi:asparagine synthase (glutamine-hydrolysing)